MWCDVMWCDAMKCNMLRDVTWRYGTVHYSTIPYDAMRSDPFRYDAMQCNAMWYDTTRYNTIQYNTIQYLCQYYDVHINSLVSPYFVCPLMLLCYFHSKCNFINILRFIIQHRENYLNNIIFLVWLYQRNHLWLLCLKQGNLRGRIPVVNEITWLILGW